MAGRALTLDIQTKDAQTRAALQRLQRDLKQVDGSIDQTARRGLSLRDALGGVAIAAGLKYATDQASDLNESVNVTGLIFKDARGEIDKFVESSTDIGLSEAKARELTGSIGGLLSNLGFAQDETIKWSKDLVTLGADMGSAFNAEPAEAIEAVGAAIRGETEPIRRFNVVLDDATVRAKAVEMGLADTTAEVDKNAKAQATLKLIMEQTSDVQGDFANTSDEAANAQRVARAEFDNAAAALGESLLPLIAGGAEIVGNLASAFADLPTPVRNSVVLLGGAAILGPRLADGYRRAATELGTMRTGLTNTAARGRDFATNMVVPTRAVEGLGTQAEVTERKTGRLGRTVQGIGFLGAAAGAVALAQAMADAGEDSVDLDRVLTGTTEDVLEELNRLDEAAAIFGDGIFADIGENDITLLYRMRDALGENYDATSALGRGIEEAERRLRQKSETQATYAGDVEELTGVERDYTAAVEDGIPVLSEARDVMVDTANAVSDSVGEYAALNDELAENISLTGDAFDAQTGYESAVLSTQDAAAALREAEASGDPGEIERARLRLTEAIGRQSEAFVTLAEKEAEVEGRTLSAAEAARVQLAELARTRAGADFTSDSLDTLVARLYDASRDYEVKLDTTEAMERITELAQALADAIAGWGTITQLGGTAINLGVGNAVGIATGNRGLGSGPTRSLGGGVTVQAQTLNVGGTRRDLDMAIERGARELAQNVRVMSGA